MVGGGEPGLVLAFVFGVDVEAVAAFTVDAGAAVLVAGGATGGGLGVKGYRAFYRYAMRRGQRALDGLLGAVAGRAEGGATRAAPPVYVPRSRRAAWRIHQRRG